MVSTLAGTGDAGADNGLASKATFNQPHDVALGPDGSLYVADWSNNLIRKIAVNGTVSTYAGTGAQGLTNDVCTKATFAGPLGIAVDAASNVYVTENAGNAIRKISPSPCTVSTLAGSPSAPGTSDGVGTAASFHAPEGLAFDASGNTLYVADFGNHKIRKVTINDGTVTTVAGTGTAGNANNDQPLEATFNAPRGIVVNAAGTLYVTESNDIRRITADGQVTTLAGSVTASLIDGTGPNAAFKGPRGITIDANGNLLVGDSTNNVVRQVTPDGVVTTIAGQRNGNIGMAGDIDGPADTAAFYGSGGVAVDSNGVIYVADSMNNKIRKIEWVQP